MNVDEYLGAAESSVANTLDRALAILWFIGRDDPGACMTPREICDVIERNGHPKQNASRLGEMLARDRRTAKAGVGAWRLVPQARRDLDEKFSTFVSAPKKVPATDSVLPRELFKGTRGYIDSVVRQINGSYDCSFYDCCTVMCRRLLETLLIEVYEAEGRANEIKSPDGHS
jgi:hypothetical protein